MQSFELITPGNAGQKVFQQLIQCTDKVTVLVRDPSRLPKIDNKLMVKIVKGDLYDYDSAKPAFEGQGIENLQILKI